MVTKAGRDYFVYHAYALPGVGDGHPRRLMIDQVAWGEDGWPSIGNGKPSKNPDVVP